MKPKNNKKNLILKPKPPFWPFMKNKPKFTKSFNTGENIHRIISTSKDPTKLWARLQKEIPMYRKDKAMLKQIQKEHQHIIHVLEKEKIEYDLQRCNLKR